METISFIPEDAQGKNAAFEGEVMLAPLSFDQRYGMIEECGFELDEKGEVGANLKALGPMRKMVKLSKPHIKKVNLVRKSDKKHFTSYDELTMDSDCDKILIGIASFLMGGNKPGKPLRG